MIATRKGVSPGVMSAAELEQYRGHWILVQFGEDRDWMLYQGGSVAIETHSLRAVEIDCRQVVRVGPYLQPPAR